MTALQTNLPARPADLNDRYRTDSGPVLITGVQAIARLLVEQHQRDRRADRRVATFASGYQGSPLAGLDRLLEGLPELTTGHEVTLVPGLNEELAATSVWGSQIGLPGETRSHDGVVGLWYGKGPGLDRAADAIRHATMYGANASGGVLALVGDDPAAKSSSVPCASERSLAALSMPVFVPRNAEEVVAFGLLGIALSRASGCWSSMKITADVADGLWTLSRDFTDMTITVPEVEWEGRPWAYRQRLLLAPPDSLLAEADLYGPRWAMVEAFNEANEIDRLELPATEAWLGIVAVGPAYDAVCDALGQLGVGPEQLGSAGIRILRVGMPYPLGASKIRELANGVEQVLVVEDKTGFVESQTRDILYRSPQRPPVLGKRDTDGRPLVPADGQVTPERLLGPLRRILGGQVPLAPSGPKQLPLTALGTNRTAYFCSGCPHNRSTAVPDGSLAAGGIGCHTLVTMSGRTDSQVTGLTQMGGEGAQWIGQAPFTDVPHIFQNVGDGTFFHSGQLAVQACVAAGVNITYKILYNEVVAMTGAQHAEAALPIAKLTHKLMAEGVRKIIVCSDEPRRHDRSAMARDVVIWHRDRLDEAQRILRDTDGVTVLIYDQHCAADARRQRKRGTLPTRRTRVVINEAVCEGCGDCGVKSNCLSVQPVDTEFGRKTRIDQSSCNTDYSCLDGDCPSFVTVEVADDGAGHRAAVPQPPRIAHPDLPEPAPTHNIFLAGIGGTGIVTVNQILGVAALRAGFRVDGLDQTGLSQKAGPVTSHLRISALAHADVAVRISNHVSAGTADCFLAFDLLTAAVPKNLAAGSTERTVAVVSTSTTPTGDMVYDATVTYPETPKLLGRVGTRARMVVDVDALGAAERLFGDTAPANLLLVGAAYQSGAFPFAARHILEAIELNGVAVEANKKAFEWGRVAVADPGAFAAHTTTAPPAQRGDTTVPGQVLVGVTITGATRDLLERRAAQLTAFQDARLARAYVAAVQRVWDAEQRVGDDCTLSAEFARNLHKLMAYKDEYEVARMLTDPAFVASVEQAVPGAHNLTYRLHPPALRALGRRTKVGFGPRSHGALRLLARGRRLRGTVFDPFGHSRMRRLERNLAVHYRDTVLGLAGTLTTENHDHAVAVAKAPELIKGYEEVKLRTVRQYVAALAALDVDTTAIGA
ncbi:indolepyruvate ferredoxin oxidoreductase family protein [Gordonia amarae]|uniref:Indolepyruvate ferredoxin oxidoreductase family protein n=2 Tax=Gordonia amarae TaxID=36821 RepID=A0A857KZF5_9ACTN|nr:indolepyruvate ferredoxin oxidoreductase family protein [Gordonia amarae]MCS3879365.1 indolepyruvate ferredoxin oxidoreductase [Gordonia amarae]QHN17843.1 indolepyruvate ferredoxin oxidoreductase family protein [Gordonia amarae]QHN22374.1 indolepyruvate ferredoxin oxidoreductase family protein [Gordonia amarae]QHN31250.1 indolepyruvate ferredoxin oxidoreductase family protein [Gordonia amarae]QHN39995.1 indolepyruvate ferredoxin oxidoreductase family protein [Gordonia amarae]